MSLRRLQPVRTLAVACAVGLLIAFAVAVPARAALPLQMGELADPAATAGDDFGQVVAIDGSTAIVGAPALDSAASSPTGAAYIYTGSGSNWARQATLTSGSASDGFGAAVALSGDTVVVGAYQTDVTVGAVLHHAQGAVYVYTRSGTGWTLQQKLTANNGAAAEWFGYSVAIDGDTLVVGVPLRTVGGHLTQGTICVFTRTGTIWTQQAEMTAADGGQDDQLGWSVAMSGNTVLAGAIHHTIAGHLDQGAAYVFTGSGASWSQQGELTQNDGASSDNFGTGVALSGDTALVGAGRHAVAGNASQGAAYVFTRSGSTWSQQVQELTATDGVAQDYFGWSLTLSGDTALISAAGRTSMQGVAYIFRRSGSTFSQVGSALAASDGAAGDQFGVGVALSGQAALVGAPYRSVGGNAAQGVVYAIRPPTIAPSVSGHGAIGPSSPQTLNWGDTPTFTFTPDPHYHVAAVAVDGNPVSMTAANAYAFPPVSADHAISVSFAIDTFTITPSVSGGHGSISPSSAQTVDYGDTPTFTFSPDPGYFTAAVAVDGSPVSMTGANAFTFPAVTVGHQLTVSFAAKSKPVLGRPACPKRTKHGKRFVVHGSFSPRLPAGLAHIAVREYRHAGHAWKLVRAYTASVVTSKNLCTYAATLKLSREGTYRFTASLAATLQSFASVSAPSRTTRVS